MHCEALNCSGLCSQWGKRVKYESQALNKNKNTLSCWFFSFKVRGSKMCMDCIIFGNSCLSRRNYATYLWPNTTRLFTILKLAIHLNFGLTLQKTKCPLIKIKKKYDLPKHQETFTWCSLLNAFNFLRRKWSLKPTSGCCMCWQISSV